MVASLVYILICVSVCDLDCELTHVVEVNMHLFNFLSFFIQKTHQNAKVELYLIDQFLVGVEVHSLVIF